VRQAYARTVRAQQRACAFAREHLSKRKPNPRQEEAKEYPTVADAPRIMVDIYAVLRNQEIQAWNVLAKVAGLPKLPTLRRRGRRRLLIDFGPEPRTLTAILPMPVAGPIGDSRRKAREHDSILHGNGLYDTEVYVPSQGPSVASGAPSALKWPSYRPRREAIYDREPWPARNSGPR
jgi:hypothetical protein